MANRTIGVAAGRRSTYNYDSKSSSTEKTNITNMADNARYERHSLAISFVVC